VLPVDQVVSLQLVFGPALTWTLESEAGLALVCATFEELRFHTGGSCRAAVKETQVGGCERHADRDGDRDKQEGKFRGVLSLPIHRSSLSRLERQIAGCSPRGVRRLSRQSPDDDNAGQRYTISSHKFRHMSTGNLFLMSDN
jgi:hypothetical protein